MALADKIDEVVKSRPDLFGNNPSLSNVLHILENNSSGITQQLAQEIDAENKTNTEQAAAELYASRLNQQAQGIYSDAVKNAANLISDQVNPIRRRVINEQARAGRLSSPVSGYNIGQVDQAQVNAVSNAVSGIQQQQAQGQLGLLNTLENIRLSNRQAGFGQQELGLQQQGLAEQIRQYEINQVFKQKLFDEDISRYATDRNRSDFLTKTAIEAAEPSLLDKINAGVSTGRNIISGLKESGRGVEDIKKLGELFP